MAHIILNGLYNFSSKKSLFFWELFKNIKTRICSINLFQDTHTTDNSSRLYLDKSSQDCNDFQAEFLLAGGHTIHQVDGVVWSFTRKFETCTKNGYEDYNIEASSHLSKIAIL